ncbi:MAG: HAD hydrolase-like protein [Kiritimatiellae bacterium]|nr:HAD hydrolase-like protein [Kiritimatiellia bacterium]
MAYDLNKKKAFVCDLDGTLFMGPNPIPPAVDFVIRTTKSGRFRFFYLTNNTSKNPSEYMKKISGAAIPVTEDQILTPLITLEAYIREKGYKSVYLVSSEAVKGHMAERLADAGVSLDYDPERNELVALTYDKELTYEKLRRMTAIWNMRNGGNAAVGLRVVGNGPVDFVATHPDTCCPSEEGPIPDVGGMLKFLEITNGMRPSHIFGKPSPTLLEPVLEHFKKEEITVVGDRLYTDKAIADNAGVDFICVLSGETTQADLDKYTGTPPALVLNNLGEVVAYGD